LQVRGGQADVTPFITALTGFCRKYLLMPAIDPVTCSFIFHGIRLGMSYREISTETGVSVGFIAKMKKLGLKGLRRILLTPKQKHPGGRPKILSPRQRRQLARQVTCLRRGNNFNFSVNQLSTAAGLRQSASERTLCRELHDCGFAWAHVRRKGVLLKEDYARRTAFAAQYGKKPPSFWKNHVSFYLDAVSFSHKYRPYSNAGCPRSRAWMLPKEKLRLTGKGNHEGTASRSVKYMVGISYQKGVVLLEHIPALNGVWFKDFIKRTFNQGFLLSQKASRLFLQDNDPVQQSSAATKEWKTLGFEQVYIPPRSPDLNPIENLFNLTKKKLIDDAIQKRILVEPLAEYKKRIEKTLHFVAKKYADNIISSMPKRCGLVVEAKGARIKY